MNRKGCHCPRNPKGDLGTVHGEGCQAEEMIAGNGGLSWAQWREPHRPPFAPPHTAHAQASTALSQPPSSCLHPTLPPAWSTVRGEEAVARHPTAAHEQGECRGQRLGSKQADGSPRGYIVRWGGPLFHQREEQLSSFNGEDLLC